MIEASLPASSPGSRVRDVDVMYTQDTIEGRLEKRSKGVFAPVGGKRLVAFIDDFNMPQKSVFGFIPPLELLKLWVDNGYWYDRLRCERKEVRDMQLLAAMAPPGGGRNPFSQRILSCFNMVCVSSPSDAQLRRIYSALLSAHLADFDDQIKPLGDSITQASLPPGCERDASSFHTIFVHCTVCFSSNLHGKHVHISGFEISKMTSCGLVISVLTVSPCCVQATVELYRNVVRELLPTPTKSHYLFNTRDLARVIQGTMRASKSFFDTKESMLALWVRLRLPLAIRWVGFPWGGSL